MKANLLSLIIFFLISNFTIAQTTIRTFSVNSSDNYNGTNYDYSVTVKYQMSDAGYGNSPTMLKVGFSNFKVSEIYYDGKKASTYLNDVGFPISKKIQADLAGSVTINRGSSSIYFKFKESAVSDGAMDTYDLTSSDRNKLFSVFGKEVTCDDVTINMTSASVSNLGVSFIGSIIDKIKKQIREEKKITAKNNTQNKKTNNTSVSEKKTARVSDSYTNENSSSNNYEETIYQKNQRLAKEKENQRIKREQKRYDDGMAFIESQNQKAKRMEANFKELEQNLTCTFNAINNQMIKESAFNSRVSSLTSIRSTSLSSIISESKQKNREINSLYDKKSSETINEIVTKGAELVRGAKNETEVAVFGGATALASVLTKNKIEKDKKEAKERLQNEKEFQINKLVTNFKKEITPLKNKYKELATYAIITTNEDYYMKQYNYYNCLLEDAFDAMQGDDNCKKPTNKTIKKKRNPTGKEYFSAYKRKSESKIDFIKAEAETFLDLAIEADPKKSMWLFEKTLIKKLDIFENAAILKKAHELNKKNLTIKKAYDKALKTIVEFEERKRNFIINTIKSNPNFDWNKHSNLMCVEFNKQYIFVNKNGEKEIVLDSNMLLVNSYGGNYEEKNFNNGLLKVGVYKNIEKNSEKSNNRANATSNLLNSMISGTNTGKNGQIKYGFINTNKEVVIQFKYDDISMFSEGLAAAKDPITKKWGYLDNKENVVIPYKYHVADKFSEGLAFVKETTKEAKWILGGNLLTDAKYRAYYIDKNNDVIIEEKFDTGDPFKNGVAEVTKYATNDSFMGGGSNKTYYINNKGERLNKQEQNLVTSSEFNNGYAVIKNGNYYSIINKEGEIVSKLKFHNKPVFKEGIAVVSTSTAFRAVFGTYTKYGYIDYTGKTIAKIKYTKASPFENGKALVELKDETFYIDKEGNKIDEDINNTINYDEFKTTESEEELKELLNKNYEEVVKSGDGYRLRKDDRFGFINKDGKITIPVSFKRLDLFYNGLAIFTNKTKGTWAKCGYVNEKGKVIVSEKYGECSNFSEGLAVVAKVNVFGRKVGYINTKGKTVIPFKFYTGTSFLNNKAQVNDGSFYKPNVYTIDKEGRKIE